MKTAKLTIGIISCVLALVVLFQSCAAGVGAALANDTSDTGGSFGVMVALFLIVGGIVGIAARKSRGGAIAATILYGIAGIFGLASSGMFKDLIIWGVISLVIAVVFFLSIFVQKYPKKVSEQSAAS